MRTGARFRGYLWAVLFTLAALVLRVWLQPSLGSRFPYATFYLAMVASAYLGGLGPGLVSLAGGALAALYFLAPWSSRESWEIGFNSHFALALYLVVASLLLWLTAGQRSLRRKAEETAALAAERGRQLESEILQRELAEESERLQRQWFEVTLASIGDAVIATDTTGAVTFLNPTATALTGWTREEATGQPIEAVFNIRNEETGEPARSPVTAAVREGKIAGLANQTVLVTRDGRSIPIDDCGAPILDHSGHVLGAVLVFHDVSHARAREAELRARERLINLSHDAIITADASRLVRSWNTGATEVYGYAAEEVRGRAIDEILQTRGDVPVDTIDSILRATGKWEGQLIHVAKDGHRVISESRQVLLRNAQGEVAGLLEINRDITERARSEEELRRTAAEAEEGRRTLEALLLHIPEGIAIVDAPDGRIRALSRYALKASDRPAESLLGAPLASHPEAWRIYAADGKMLARPDQLPLARAILRGEIVTDEEWSLSDEDGSLSPILCSAAPIRDCDGHITGGLVTWRDISHRKRLDARLREAAKLESLGVLAGGIAHDFNNLLTGILGNASLLLEELETGTQAARHAQAISRTAEHAARLTQQMLAYSGRGRFVVEPIDLSAYIRDLSALLTAAIPKNVDLTLDLAATLPPVEVDTAQLQQVVMNLIVNGAEAIGAAGGHLEIRTRAEQVDDPAQLGPEVGEELQPGLYVILDVRDTGCGMDKDTLPRIFDPFFTTKFTGRGLGLAAVQGIVRGHRGSIQVASAPGAGTTFTVYLPAGTSPLRTIPLEPAAEEAELPHGSGTILLVDDEEMVRAVACAALEHLGYKVALAGSGEEAVETFRRLSGGIRAVILDMTMPGLSGEDTMRLLREIRPAVPILLSSGFSEVEALQRFADLGLGGFLQKPYTVRSLAEKVSSLPAV